METADFEKNFFYFQQNKKEKYQKKIGTKKLTFEKRKKFPTQRLHRPFSRWKRRKRPLSTLFIIAWKSVNCKVFHCLFLKYSWKSWPFFGKYQEEKGFFPFFVDFFSPFPIKVVFARTCFRKEKNKGMKIPAVSSFFPGFLLTFLGWLRYTIIL